MNPFGRLLTQRLYKQGDMLSIIHLAKRIHDNMMPYVGPDSVGPIVRYCYRFLRQHVCAASAKAFIEYHKDCIYEDDND